MRILDAWEQAVTLKMTFFVSMSLILTASEAAVAVDSCDHFEVESPSRLSEVKEDEYPFSLSVFTPLNEFFKFGGKGTLFSFNLKTKDYSEGFYIKPDQYPERTHESANYFIFRDERVLKLVNSLKGDSVPVLLTHVGRGTAGSARDPESVIGAASIKCGLFPNFEGMLILNQYSDLYVIHHELKHLDDMKSGVLSTIRNRFTDLKKISSLTQLEVDWLNAFTREQRAYVVELDLAKKSTEGKEYIIEDLVIRSVDRAEFVNKKLSEKVDNLQRYALQVLPILEKLKTQEPKAYEESKEILKQYSLDSAELGLKAMLPGHF